MPWGRPGGHLSDGGGPTALKALPRSPQPPSPRATTGPSGHRDARAGRGRAGPAEGEGGPQRWRGRGRRARRRAGERGRSPSSHCPPGRRGGARGMREAGGGRVGLRRLWGSRASCPVPRRARAAPAASPRLASLRFPSPPRRAGRWRSSRPPVRRRRRAVAPAPAGGGRAAGGWAAARAEARRGPVPLGRDGTLLPRGGEKRRLTSGRGFLSPFPKPRDRAGFARPHRCRCRGGRF